MQLRHLRTADWQVLTRLMSDNDWGSNTDENEARILSQQFLTEADSQTMIHDIIINTIGSRVRSNNHLRASNSRQFAEELTARHYNRGDH